MLFPLNTQMFPPYGADLDLLSYGSGCIYIVKGFAPFGAEGAIHPMIEVCTATNAEIEERAAHGESDFDVMDEHTSRLWFHDRASFKAAWSMARAICRGRLVECDWDAGDIIGINRMYGQPVAPFVVTLSGHHIAPREAA